MKKIIYVLVCLVLLFFLIESLTDKSPSASNNSSKNRTSSSSPVLIYDSVQQKVVIQNSTRYSIPQHPNRGRRESQASFQRRMESYRKALRAYDEERKQEEAKRYEEIRKREAANRQNVQPVYSRPPSYRELQDRVEELEYKVNELESR